jgi:hypothetical protein
MSSDRRQSRAKKAAPEGAAEASVSSRPMVNAAAYFG